MAEAERFCVFQFSKKQRRGIQVSGSEGDMSEREREREREKKKERKRNREKQRENERKRTDNVLLQLQRALCDRSKMEVMFTSDKLNLEPNTIEMKQ